MCRIVVPLLTAGVLVGTVTSARAQPRMDGLRRRAEYLGQRAALEFTGEDAVPFVSPQRERAASRKAHPVAQVEEIRVPLDDVELLAWLVNPIRGVEHRGLVVVVPGWQSNAGLGLQRTAFLLGEGYQLLIVEGRANAYADSGRAAEFRGFIREDASDLGRAIDHLASTRQIGDTPVVLFGFAWGGLKVVLTAAERTDVRAVIIDAAPRSALHLARERFREYMPPDARDDLELVRYFVEAFDAEVEARLGYRPSEIDVEQALKRIAPRPVMVIHSRDDDFVPFSDGEWLAQRAKEPRTFLQGERFGHCLGMKRTPEIYTRAVVAFLRGATDRSLVLSP